MMFPSTTSIFWIQLLILAGAAIPFVASHTTNSTANKDDEYILPRLPLPKYNEKGEILFFPRIVGGSVAGLGEYPGKVSLQQRNGNHFCGGTIIDQTHVVTAAHCVTNDRAVVINPSLVNYLKKKYIYTEYIFTILFLFRYKYKEMICGLRVKDHHLDRSEEFHIFSFTLSTA